MATEESKREFAPAVTMTSKILLSVSSDTTSELDRLAEKYCISRTELIRRSLALLLVVDRELSVDPSKRKLAIVQGERVIERLIFA